ncbi:MAG: M23 family metallopeptidase, partial [Candidatus Woesearchaeota archaeon]
GEFSQYLHLKFKGSLVKTGVRVKKGQPIALSGNTGFTTAPHLHFIVFRLNNTEIGWESLKVRFNKRVFVDRSDGPIPRKFDKTMKELKRIRKSTK